MWSSLLGLALLAGLDPVRVAIALLMISRPRPVQNLFAYWATSMATCIPTLVVPLTLIHVIPTFRSFTQDLGNPATTAGSIARHIQLGMGMLALSIGALIAVRSLIRRRQRAQSPTPGGKTSTMVLDARTPNAISRLLSRTQAAPTESGRATRGPLRRLETGWEKGSVWVAVMIALVYGGPAPSLALFVLAIIVASGAAIGTQVSATISFVITMLAIVEIALASYLAAPAKTQAVLQVVHDWAQSHRRKILVIGSIVGGLWLVGNGMVSF